MTREGPQAAARCQTPQFECSVPAGGDDPLLSRDAARTDLTTKTHCIAGKDPAWARPGLNSQIKARPGPISIFLLLQN